MTRREFFTSIPEGFECEVRYYCSTCQEEVLEDDFKTHKCEDLPTIIPHYRCPPNR